MNLLRNWLQQTTQIDNIHGLYVDKVRELRYQISFKTKVFQIPVKQNIFYWSE